MKVGRPHGLDGSFHVDAPLEEGETVTIGDRDYTVVERKGTDSKPIIRLEGIDNREAAESLRGETLSPTSDERPATSEDEWLIDDLIGCEISGLGKVTGVLEGTSCDVLEVGDQLIPLVREAVTKVDIDLKRIEINREFLGL